MYLTVYVCVPGALSMIKYCERKNDIEIEIIGCDLTAKIKLTTEGNWRIQYYKVVQLKLVTLNHFVNAVRVKSVLTTAF